MPDDKNIFLELEKGQILFSEGEKGEEMYIVLSGVVQVFLLREGLQVLLADMGAGHFFGEMSLLEQETRSASVIALEPTRLLVINNDNFQHFICHNPSLAVKIMKGLSGRVRSSNEQISLLEHELHTAAKDSFPEADGGEKEGRVQKMITSRELERRLEENLQKVRKEEFSCPLCYNTFQAYMMRTKDFSLKSRNYWLRDFYEGIEPLLFKQVGCPSCSFSAPGDRFMEIGQMGREYLKEKEQSRKDALDLSSFSDFNYDYVLGLYRLTLLSLQKKGENFETLAQTALELSWLYRDLQNWEGEQEALKNALDYFEEIQSQEGFQNPDLLQKSLYYQGLINLRLQNNEQAKPFFEQVLGVKGAQKTLLFLFARNILESLLLDRPVKV